MYLSLETIQYLIIIRLHSPPGYSIVTLRYAFYELGSSRPFVRVWLAKYHSFGKPGVHLVKSSSSFTGRGFSVNSPHKQFSSEYIIFHLLASAIQPSSLKRSLQRSARVAQRVEGESGPYHRRPVADVGA